MCWNTTSVARSWYSSLPASLTNHFEEFSSNTSLVSILQRHGNAGFLHVDGHRHSLDYTIRTCLDHWNSHLQSVVLHKHDHVLHCAQTVRLIWIEREGIIIFFAIIREPWKRHLPSSPLRSHIMLHFSSLAHTFQV